MSTKQEHISFAILPFEIKSYLTNNDPFDFQFDHSMINHDISEFKKAIAQISIPESTYKLDTKKYHYHIHNFISSGFENDDRSLVKYYKIKPELLFSKEKLTVRDKWEVSFSGNTHVIVNELVRIGYFVFGFKFIAKEGVLLSDFSKLDFFRFYNNDKSYRKYAMRREGKGGDEINELNKLSIEDVISISFKDLCPYIKLRYERPSLLHLSNSFWGLNEIDLDYFLYNSLRIQASNLIGSNNLSKDYTIRSGSGVSMCVLNEGASIVDMSVSDLKQLQSKYLTAFLMVLNQREVMIHINQLSMELTLKQLQDSSMATIEYLNNLKTQIELFRFKQLVYSVSFFEEIVIFYKKLQGAMDINLLLLDNKECVDEISNLLAKNKYNQQTEIRKIEIDSQRKRDLWINTTLTGIGCLGMFSFLKDLIPFTFDDQLNTQLGGYSFVYKGFSALSPLILFVGLFRLMRKGAGQQQF